MVRACTLLRPHHHVSFFRLANLTVQRADQTHTHPTTTTTGIIPRAVASLFEKLEASGADFTVRISFLEIYQENLEDLLEPSSSSSGKGPAPAAASSSSAKTGGLRLVEDAKKGVQVLGLEEVGVADFPAAIALLQKGVQNRCVLFILCVLSLVID